MATILSTVEEAAQRLERSVVTIGNFDGMHRGHQAIFEQVVELAKEQEATPVALTFEPHPIAYFRPDAAPERVSPAGQKFGLMGDAGAQLVVALTFDEELANQSPQTFVEEVLHKGLKATHVVVGEDFRFGKKRAGDTDTLGELGASFGMKCTVAEFVTWKGEPISSTRIRGAISEGDVEAARQMLGRPHRLCGTVVHGEKRGRKIGYPTANMNVAEAAIPANGIYVTTLGRAGEEHWRAVTSIGHRPTFDGDGRTVETYVMDDVDDLDLYGDEIELDFYRRVREEKKFDSVEELVVEMDRDVEMARQFFEEESI